MPRRATTGARGRAGGPARPRAHPARPGRDRARLVPGPRRRRLSRRPAARRRPRAHRRAHRPATRDRLVDRCRRASARRAAAAAAGRPGRGARSSVSDRDDAVGRGVLRRRRRGPACATPAAPAAAPVRLGSPSAPSCSRWGRRSTGRVPWTSRGPPCCTPSPSPSAGANTWPSSRRAACARCRPRSAARPEEATQLAASAEDVAQRHGLIEHFNTATLWAAKGWVALHDTAAAGAGALPAGAGAGAAGRPARGGRGAAHGVGDGRGAPRVAHDGAAAPRRGV